ncbi:MAG: glycosyltransferase family 9 protein [Thermodesulfovibrionaceae bacterium]
MLKKVEKVLIVKPSSLGDIVHSLAFANTLKENFPYVRIHWVVAKEFEDLLCCHPLVEKIFIIDKSKWKNLKNSLNTIKDLVSLRKRLRREKYDIVFDLQGLFRSGLITSFTEASLKIGFTEGRELSPIFYNKKFSSPLNKHAVMRYLDIAKNIGCKVNSVKFPLPASIKPNWLSNYKDFVGIVISARWQSKNWPLSYFIELIDLLPYNFILVGSNSDISDATKIEKASKGKAISYAGKTSLRELIAVFENSFFVISPDTGAMHLAVACGKKVVALFGPTDPVRTGPFGEGHLIIKSNESCSPCFKRYCKDHRCMKNITPQIVHEEIKRWLELKSVE